MNDYENELEQLRLSIECIPSIFLYKMMLVIQNEVANRNQGCYPSERVKEKSKRPVLTVVKNNESFDKEENRDDY